MSLLIDFKGDTPDGNGVVWTEYYKIIGSPEDCVIDVFVDDMNHVAYTISKNKPASVARTNKEVAILSASLGKNTLIGISIRNPASVKSGMPQKKFSYFDYTFKQEPITKLESEG